jgi:uncharacterized protein (DUF1697 family)
MSIQVGLLRGINVGGHNAVAMSDLRALLTDLGFSGATTLLQSGNVVFRGKGPGGEALEQLLEKETAERLGVSVDHLVRSASEWAKIVADNPFPKEAKNDPSHLVVMFLKTASTASAVKSLQASIKGPEVVRGRGKEVYISYPAGIGTSKLTGSLIEKRLDSRGTARNWNTVLKLLALATDPDRAGSES